MAIDTVIDYACVPKQTLTTDGIVERLKARDRAGTVIQLFRANGDQRPPSEMGFEMTRTALDGAEETQVVIVQHMLDLAAELDPLAGYCVGCPANVRAASRGSAVPFGCIGFIQYPISAAAERWLLDRLPGTDEPLEWLLLRQGVQEMNYSGESVKPLRADPTYFEEKRVAGRDLVEFIFTANQAFEMLFLLGDIQPAHAGILLLLFGAIQRGVDAVQIVAIMKRQLTPDEIARDYPFQMTIHEHDDQTIAELKAFFYALYRAWSLDVALKLDV